MRSPTIVGLSFVMLLGCAPGGTSESSSRPPTTSTDDAGTEDAISPTGEVCGNGIDDDGDGAIDDGCSCTGGSTQPCYPSGLAGVCGGTQTCEGGEFGGWGACEGAPAPAPEECADGIDQDCDGSDLACERPTDACDGATRMTGTTTLSFPNPLRSLGHCPWGHDDNLGQNGGRFTARHEVVQSLTPPAGAVLCAMEFEVAETGMFYDDWMFVTFDDVVVLSPFDPAPLFPEVDGLWRYDWSALVGQPHTGAAPYCPGAASACALPDTEASGSIRLELDEETQRRLADIAAIEGRYDFTVVATGDDNDDRDCAHSDFEMVVAFEYVLR